VMQVEHPFTQNFFQTIRSQGVLAYVI
jgi:hypothetical protein